MKHKSNSYKRLPTPSDTKSSDYRSSLTLVKENTKKVSTTAWKFHGGARSNSRRDELGDGNTFLDNISASRINPAH